MFRKGYRRFVVSLVVALLVPQYTSAQTAVTLSPGASPSAGQPGVTTVTLTGTGFPAGTIQPASVTVSLAPVAGGTNVTATASASAVTIIVGTTRRIAFTIPSSISVAAPAAYSVSISGTTTSGTAFVSSNSASLTINPAAQIISVTPASGNTGQTATVTITGAYTNFVQGSTVANFGPGILAEPAKGLSGRSR